MEIITRTAYGSYLQTNMLLGLNHKVLPSTTLNEKFNIQSGILPPNSATPVLRYYAIGNGGHSMATGPGGVQYPKGLQHKATDAAAFNHLPFVLREPTSDLTQQERANYGLRREEVHQGATYVAYYLKRIPMAGVVPQMEYHVVKDGADTPSPFVPDSSNLNPIPSQLANTGVNVVSGDYVSTTARVPLTMSAWDAAEFLNVARVIYDTDDLAIVSEIELCSAVDKVVPVTVNGATTNFNEAVGVQVCSHFACFFPMKYNNNGVELLLDIGATEPLFALDPVTGGTSV